MGEKQISFTLGGDIAKKIQELKESEEYSTVPEDELLSILLERGLDKAQYEEEDDDEEVYRLTPKGCYIVSQMEIYPYGMAVDNADSCFDTFLQTLERHGYKIVEIGSDDTDTR